jgi:hypothetical protein
MLCGPHPSRAEKIAMRRAPIGAITKQFGGWWLVAAATPVFYNARSDGSADDLHSQVDANGMPTSYPLYTATGTVKDAALTVPCTAPRPAGLACGDFTVNTIQPPYQPYAPGTAGARRLPPQKAATIGDRLSDKGIDWAWYSGGWSNANGDVDHGHDRAPLRASPADVGRSRGPGSLDRIRSRRSPLRLSGAPVEGGDPAAARSGQPPPDGLLEPRGVLAVEHPEARRDEQVGRDRRQRTCRHAAQSATAGAGIVATVRNRTCCVRLAR